MRTRARNSIGERSCSTDSPAVLGPEIPFTSKDYGALPDGFPAELIGGRLYRSLPPTIRHQQLVRRIALALAECVHSERILFAPLELDLGPKNILHPDLVVLGKEAPPARGPPDGSSAGRIPLPQAVFEVLLEPTADRERRLKAPVYLAGGVNEVWLVDPAACNLELLTCKRGRVVAGAHPARSTVVSGLELWPDYLFRP